MLESCPSPQILRDALGAHRLRLEGAGSDSDVDLGTATALHVRLMAALERWDSFGADDQEQLADAVAYVARLDDDRHDTESPDGLDDDARRVGDLLRRLHA
jgi:hypothetical protein